LRNHRDAAFLFSGLLAVIDPLSVPQDVYAFFKQTGAPSVDFLYRDGNRSRLPVGKHSTHSIEYGSWLAALFDIYLSDPTPIRIRILDDVTKLILGGYTSKEGLGLNDFAIAIIDTDGSITKNDTLKSSFDGADRFKTTWSVQTHPFTSILRSSEFAAYHRSQRPTSESCQSCPYLRICGGGMTLHRWSDENGFDNPSVYCADQIFLIEHIRNRLADLRACTA
jgi:uncharacterized protein